MTSPFRKPSEAPAPNSTGLNEFEGALAIYTVRGRSDVTTKYKNDDGSAKVKSVVDVDIDVVEGVADGTVSAMPSREFGVAPKSLTDQTGAHVENVRVFAGWVAGAFNGMEAGGKVLGRLIVTGKEYEGKNQPTWILQDATEAEIQKAVTFLNERSAASLSKTATPAAAATVIDEPNF